MEKRYHYNSLGLETIYVFEIRPSQHSDIDILYYVKYEYDSPEDKARTYWCSSYNWHKTPAIAVAAYYKEQNSTF